MYKEKLRIFLNSLSPILSIIICLILLGTTPTMTNENITFLSDQSDIFVQTQNDICQQTMTEPTEQIQPTTTDDTISEFITFSPDITFESDYITPTDLLPYAIYKPSCANENTPSALIIWLHGTHDINAKSTDFMSRYFPGMMSDWTSTGFNAYVVCPQLTNSYRSDTWCTPSIEIGLRMLISEIANTYNIDMNKIYLTGASLGGQGVIYHAVRMGDVFNKAAALSGYGSMTKYSEIKIPMLGIVGKQSHGEDANSIRFMESHIKPNIHENNYLSLPESHSDLPEMAFSLDHNNNNCSDIIEWFFSDSDYFELTEEK